MILNALIISLIVWFIKATTWKGHIFEKVDDFIQFLLTPRAWYELTVLEIDSSQIERKPRKIYMPIIGCNLCMTPWWGFAIYTLAHFEHIPGFEVYTFWRIVFTLFIAGGFSAILMVFGKLGTDIDRAQKSIDEINKNSYI